MHTLLLIITTIVIVLADDDNTHLLQKAFLGSTVSLNFGPEVQDVEAWLNDDYYQIIYRGKFDEWGVIF